MAAYLVLSDIHSNLDALEAVLAAVDGQWDRLLVLGDLVGYGGEPNGVIDRIRALNPVAVIRGNHDKAACGIDDASNFNQIAKYAAMWTGEALTADNREYLRAPPGRPGDDRRARRDLPRLAVRRGPLHLRRRRRAARDGDQRASAVPVRAHPPAGRVQDRRA